MPVAIWKLFLKEWKEQKILINVNHLPKKTFTYLICQNGFHKKMWKNKGLIFVYVLLLELEIKGKYILIYIKGF